MKDQHTLITGYRDLSQDEIDIMNAIKKQGEVVRELCDKIGNGTGMANPADARWVAIARTHLQEGFMALTRAIAKPTSF